MKYPDVVTLFEPTKSSYGVDTLEDDGLELQGLFVQTLANEHAAGRDSLASTAVLHLPLDDELAEIGMRIEGWIVLVNPLEIEDAKQYFKIREVTIARDSLRSNAVHHLECSLDKYASPE